MQCFRCLLLLGLTAKLAPTKITSRGRAALFPICLLSGLLSLVHMLPQRHGRLPSRSMSALLLLLNLWEWLFIVSVLPPEASPHPPQSSRLAARQGWSGSSGPGRFGIHRVAKACTGVAEGASCQFSQTFSLRQITTSTASQWSYLSLLDLKLQISFIILRYSKSHTPFYIYISAPHFQCGNKWEIKSIPSLDHCLSTQQSPWDSSQY